MSVEKIFISAFSPLFIHFIPFNFLHSSIITHLWEIYYSYFLLMGTHQSGLLVSFFFFVLAHFRVLCYSSKKFPSYIFPFLTNDPQPCSCSSICFWSFYLLISLYGIGSLASQMPSLIHSLTCLLDSPFQLVSIVLSTNLRSYSSFLVSSFFFHLFGWKCLSF